jgi:hypothetical protein
MVNVTNRPDIHVRLCPLELLLRHRLCSSLEFRKPCCEI